MSDIPVKTDSITPPSGDTKQLIQQKDSKIEVTKENASLLTVHFLSQIHGRLGYIIKLLESGNGRSST